MPQIVNGQAVGILPLSLEQLQAISDSLHGKHKVRMNPDDPWTALKLLDLLTIVDSELALLKAEVALENKVLKY